MTDLQLDVASLVSRIQQLEERQNSTAQYAVRVKRQLDELTEQFNDLQQRFSQSPAFPWTFDSPSSPQFWGENVFKVPQNWGI